MGTSRSGGGHVLPPPPPPEYNTVILLRYEILDIQVKTQHSVRSYNFVFGTRIESSRFSNETSLLQEHSLLAIAVKTWLHG